MDLSCYSCKGKKERLTKCVLKTSPGSETCEGQNGIVSSRFSIYVGRSFLGRHLLGNVSRGEEQDEVSVTKLSVYLHIFPLI